jgi:hypothetical protein
MLRLPLIVILVDRWSVAFASQNMMTIKAGNAPGDIVSARIACDIMSMPFPSRDVQMSNVTMSWPRMT